MKKINVGRFGKVFGVKGWITVRSYTNPKENILQYSPWFIDRPNAAEPEVMTITESKIHGEKILVKLPTCDDCDQARLYTNLEISVDHTLLPEPQEGEYYWANLEGMTVINLRDITLGQVDYLTNTGANDIVIVKDDETKRERWIPFIPDVIKEVDSNKRIIRVDWDENF